MTEKYLNICFPLVLRTTLSFVAISTAHAKTYYISSQGDDENPGTASQPLLTISRGAELALPGDTVLVQEGVYRERVAPPRGGKQGQPITYMAAPGERVVIKGSEVWQPDWKSARPGIFFASPDPALFNDRRDEYVDSHNPFKVELASTPWQREGRREIERGYRGDPDIVYTCGQIFVDGVRLREVPQKAELEPNSWYYEPTSERVYVHFGNSKPTDKVVEITTRRRIFAPVKRGLSHITVQGFIMEHCGNQYPTNFWEVNANGQKGALGIEGGNHWIIRRNLIRHAKTFAIDAGYVDKRTRRLNPRNNLIEENYILENGSAGILSNCSKNMVIRNNVILRNNTLRFFELKRWEQAGIKCHNIQNGLIAGNYISDNTLTYGIWLDNQFPDSRVSRNVLVNNERAGIFLEMSDYGFDRLLVDNNIIVGNRENPVYIHDASGATFVHNLLANTEADPEYGQGIFIRQVSARTKTYHHSFYNNLLFGNAVNVDANYPSHRSGPQKFDYNLYGCRESDRSFRINKKSEKPSPWTNKRFVDLVSAEIKGKLTIGNAYKTGRLSLTFDQWKSFWNTHHLRNDQHSTLSPNSTASYSAENLSVTINLQHPADSLTTKQVDRVDQDFFGTNRDRRTHPGPFHKLKSGTNTFQVWQGLPILAEGQLPSRDWNKLDAK